MRELANTLLPLGAWNLRRRIPTGHRGSRCRPDLTATTRRCRQRTPLIGTTVTAAAQALIPATAYRTL